MSLQELKDESKESDGSPEMKRKIRMAQRELLRRSVQLAVPQSTVIITNPTHFAVALKYDSATMPAPVVLAKGADEVAARIRELGTANKVPIIRNPPLARILYDTTEIDDEIPIEHYQAVAKIIGYVYRLKGKVPAEAKPTTPNQKGPGPIMKMKK